MRTVLNTPDGVTPTGCGWVDELLKNMNCKLTEQIGLADEAGDTRQVKSLLLEQARMNLTPPPSP